MPIGVILNASVILIGGLIGGFLGDRLNDKFKDNMIMIFGISSMGMGAASIVQMKFLPAVILSLLIGTAFSFLINFDTRVNGYALWLEKKISAMFAKHTVGKDMASTDLLVTCIVVFCASGTGIYGTLDSGITGDQTLLVTKSILDFIAAIIFSTKLGFVIAPIAIPQFVIFMTLYILAGYIVPLTTPDMILDFKAAGGFIILATGFRLVNVKMFPIVDMLPAMLIVMPLSFLWATYVMPLISG